MTIIKNNFNLLISIAVVVSFVGIGVLNIFFGGSPIMLYDGEYPELEVVAINSVPGVWRSDMSDQVLVLEKDSYGRTLFVCKLTRVFTYINSTQNGVLAIIISQKTDLETVCYYTEINYDLAFLEDYETLATDELISSHFSEQDIETLKEKNDWNKPLEPDNSRYTKILNVLDKKTYMNKKEEKTVEKNIGSNFNGSFYRTFSSNQSIYFILNINYSDIDEYGWYFIVMDDEGNLPYGEDSIHKVRDKENLSGEMLEFLDKISSQNLS